MSSASKLLVSIPLLIATTARTVLAQQQDKQPSFQSFSPSFDEILGSYSKITLLNEADQPLYHEAAIYHEPSSSLFVSSNQIPTSGDSPNTGGKKIIISRVTGLYDDGTDPFKIETISAPEIPLPNGGFRWKYDGEGGGEAQDKLLWCAQGSLADDPPAGLVAMDPYPPYKTSKVLTSYYGKPFNSPNDVVVAKDDGAIWFTDTNYGNVQGIRPAPQLPNQVYRFDRLTNSTRAVADGFVRLNGIAFAEDGKVLYVTDTGAAVGDGKERPRGPATVYAFDVVDGKQGGVFLANRRLFAYATNGYPDGLKVDTKGNVYVGDGDGVTVYNAGGMLLGKVLIPGGCANFAIGEPGTLFLLNEKRLYRADISLNVMDAARAS